MLIVVQADVGLGTSMAIHNSTFVENSAGVLDSQHYKSSWGTPKAGGGAVSVQGFESLLSCTKVLFTGNHAGRGGAIVGDENSKVEIKHSYMSGNSAVLGGAVAFVNGIWIYLNGNTLTNNSGQQGGAVYVKGLEFPYPDDVMRKNESIHSQNDSATIWIIDNIFSKNTALLGGGGLQISGVSLLCTNCSFQSNAAQVGGSEIHGGGGIRAKSRALVILRNSSIISCTARTGGGVSLEDSVLVATNLHLFGNHAIQFGGAIGVWLGEYSTVRGPVVAECHDCLIEANRADEGGRNS